MEREVKGEEGNECLEMLMIRGDGKARRPVY